jgi:hypothetical protein
MKLKISNRNNIILFDQEKPHPSNYANVILEEEEEGGCGNDEIGASCHRVACSATRKDGSRLGWSRGSGRRCGSSR